MSEWDSYATDSSGEAGAEAGDAGGYDGADYGQADGYDGSNQSYGEETTGYDGDSGVVADWAKRTEHVVDFAEANPNTVVVGNGGSDQSFEQLVGSYGEATEATAEHIEDGHQGEVMTIWTGDSEYDPNGQVHSDFEPFGPE